MRAYLSPLILSLCFCSCSQSDFDDAAYEANLLATDTMEGAKGVYHSAREGAIDAYVYGKESYHDFRGEDSSRDEEAEEDTEEASETPVKNQPKQTISDKDYY